MYMGGIKSNCSLLGKVNVLGQISLDLFAPKEVLMFFFSTLHVGNKKGYVEYFKKTVVAYVLSGSVSVGAVRNTIRLFWIR